MGPVSHLERTLARVAVVASVAVFIGLLLWLPAFYPSFDEAKYFGIGYSVLAGNGPRTLFGALFLTHAPLWSTVVAAPAVWFGVNAASWGHVLNGLSGAAFIVLVSAFGWRLRPAVGGLAAGGCLAVPYVHDLARTARLDVPAAMLVLLYVWLGLRAVRTGSVLWAIAAGAAFGAGFLIKETSLPFAPIPFIVGVLERRPWTSLSRVGGAILLVAWSISAWWFVVYAGFTHVVYRLGAPAWTLVPLTIGIAVLGIGGLLADVVSRRLRAYGTVGRVADRVPPVVQAHARTIAGWGLAVAWFAVLAVFFSRQGDLQGSGLFAPRQIGLWLSTWLPQLRWVVAFGVVGLILAVVAWIREPGPYRDGLTAMFVASICGLSLALFVIAVGEPPRNDLAQIGFVIVIGAGGWYWLAERLLRLRVRDADRLAPAAFGAALGAATGLLVTALTPITSRPALVVGTVVGLLAGLAETWRGGPRIRAHGGPSLAVGVGIVTTVLVCSSVLASHALARRGSGPDDPRAKAVTTVTDWIKAHVPAGTDVGFGSLLGYEMALELRGRHPMDQIHQTLALSDVDATDGFRILGDDPADEPIAVDIHPRRAVEFQVFGAGAFSEAIRAHGVQVYVYTTGTTTSVPSLVPALTPEHGFTQLAHWTWPLSSNPASMPLESFVFAVDQSRVSFAGSPLYMGPDALDRWLSLAEAKGARAARAAKHLLARVQLTGEGAERPALLDRLTRLANG